MEKFTWSMEGIECWNLLLLLLAGKGASKVLEFLQLLQETIQVLHLSYVFESQCKEKD
jgi:hypothetical protein